jgi:hypothetical protein
MDDEGCFDALVRIFGHALTTCKKRRRFLETAVEYVVRLQLLFSTCVFAFSLTGQSPGIPLLNLRKSDGSLYKAHTSNTPATVVVFVSAVCPMSMEYSQRLNQLAADYSPRGVQILVVNSNTNESDAEVEKQRQEAGISVPVYRDNGNVADLLGAIATPTAVVIDKTGMIRYLGMIDNSRNSTRVTRRPLRSALDAVLEGRPVEVPRTKVMGCTIKPGT